MIIDAKDTILGRLSTFAAKQALLGNQVNVINCEECIISGRKHAILDEYFRKSKRKAPTKAPYFYRSPEMLVKRTIRGMLPFKRSRGRVVYKNIKCYIGVPDSLKNEKAVRIEDSGHDKLHSADYIRIKDICRAFGAKI